MKAFQKAVALSLLFVLGCAGAGTHRVPASLASGNSGQSGKSEFDIDWTPDGKRVVVKFCSADGTCETLGNTDGYDPKDFSLHPLVRKSYAIAMGAVEGVGAVGVGILAFTVAVSSCGAVAVAGTTTIASNVVGVGTLVVGEGTVYALSKDLREINPERQWKEANLSDMMNKAANEHRSISIPVNDKQIDEKRSIVLQILTGLPSNEVHPDSD